MLKIKNATIYTMAGQVLENSDILCEDGKIKEVGNIPASADVEIDATGLVVIPGIIDAHSHIGTMDTKRDTHDNNEMTQPATPDVSIVYGFDPEGADVKRALRAGITTVGLAPGSGNVVGGEVVAMKTYGTNPFDMVVKRPIALKCATGFNPKNVYGPKDQRPLTRMGIAQIMIDLLLDGQQYMEKKQLAAEGKGEAPNYNPGLELVEKVLRREIPLKMHSGGFDMLTGIEIASRFNVLLTLDHASGAGHFAKEIAEANVFGVIGGPWGGPAHMVGEGKRNSAYDVVECHRQGVTCAIMTDGPILKQDALIYEAGEAVRLGLSVEDALAMLTINAAKIILCDDRLGSIEPGKDADFAIFRGVPALDTDATVMYTISGGNIAYQRQ